MTIISIEKYAIWESLLSNNIYNYLNYMYLCLINNGISGANLSWNMAHFWSNIYMLLGSIPVDDYLFEITVDYILSLPEAVDGCALKDWLEIFK